MLIQLLFCITFVFLLDVPSGYTQVVDVPLQGELYWSLVFRYSNLNNSGTIKHTYTSRITRSYSYSAITEAVNEFKRSDSNRRTNKLNIGGAYEAISASLEMTSERSTEVNTFLRSRQEKSLKSQYEETNEEVREYIVGPNSLLELYQLNFRAPGVHLTFNALSSVYEQPKKFTFHIQVTPIRFLQDIKVFYANNEGGRPTNRIRAANNENDDINYRFGGKYVYLVPVYTYDVASAMTGIDVVITDTPKPGYDDVAAGAGGAYRYIVPVRNTFNRSKITDVSLLRSKERINGRFLSSSMSIDINAGRKNDYLYLVWKTVNV